jgi:hypothetical protein
VACSTIPLRAVRCREFGWHAPCVPSLRDTQRRETMFGLGIVGTIILILLILWILGVIG